MNPKCRLTATLPANALTSASLSQPKPLLCVLGLGFQGVGLALGAPWSTPGPIQRAVVLYPTGAT